LQQMRRNDACERTDLPLAPGENPRAEAASTQYESSVEGAVLIASPSAGLGVTAGCTLASIERSPRRQRWRHLGRSSTSIADYEQTVPTDE